MARKLRIEFEGAFYHVISRGNQRQKIFKETADYRHYLQLLTNYRTRYHYHLYAYVLMANHVHLLIETGESPLSKVLQGINQSYTVYFNRKYRTVGHLFQGRYKAILCDRDRYLLALLQYIHNNPIRAKVVENPQEYPWSSHQAYSRGKDALGLVETSRVLRMFSENKVQAYKGYRNFMAGGEVLDREEVYATIDQRLQGDEEFVDRVLERYDGEIKRERKARQYTLAQIARVVGKQYNLILNGLRSAGKEQRLMQGRRAFSAVARGFGYKGKEIAAYLRKEPSSVTKYVQGEGVESEAKKLIALLAEDKNGNFQV